LSFSASVTAYSLIAKKMFFLWQLPLLAFTKIGD